MMRNSQLGAELSVDITRTAHGAEPVRTRETRTVHWTDALPVAVAELSTTPADTPGTYELQVVVIEELAQLAITLPRATRSRVDPQQQ